MKPQYLLSAATAVLGFAVAWLVKPSATPSPDPGQVAVEQHPTTKTGDRTGPDPRPTSPTGKRPTEVKAGDFPLAEQYEKGPKTRNEAKMLRLTEALGLSIDQQGAIVTLMEKIKEDKSETGSVIMDLTKRGSSVEEGLREILTPEQFTKFQEVRERQRDNGVEVRAQQLLTQVMQDADMSPGQRDEALARLRQKAKVDLQTIPLSASLLIDGSLLPTGQQELSAEGVLTLAKMGEEPVELLDPEVAHQKVLEKQKAELEDMLGCFDGILSPGQMGQYQARIAEQRAMVQRVATARPPAAEAPKTVAPEKPKDAVAGGGGIVIPDDDEADGTETEDGAGEE